MEPDLECFVQRARERGLDLVSIRTLLLSAGWKEKQILAAFRGADPELAIPEPPAGGTARDACLHLLAFVALYAWVISLVLCVFSYVDLGFPDPAWREDDFWRQAVLSSVRAKLATLLVAFPAFLLLWRFLLREVRQKPEKARNAVRRWLTYLSVFVGTVTLAANTITLVYYLFEGELSTRFLLKVATLFLVTGGSLVYLRIAMREPASTP